MRFTVVTLFPQMFESALAAGVVGRAFEAGTLRVDFVDPRDFTSDRHRTVDDTPYGGGPGMVMKVEPLVAALESIHPAGRESGSGEAGAASEAGEAGEVGEAGRAPHRILMSPRGAPLGQRRVRELARMNHLVLVCGRYEGIDERVAELAIDEEISLGDFVLSGGELAAMAVIDAVARYVPGVLGEAASTDEESFSGSLLEYPQYTRPASFRGQGIPEVLVSGHHARIAAWRRAEALRLTAARRPDLLARHRFTDDDRALWAGLAEADLARRTHVALVHHPVYDRQRRVVTTAITNLDLHDIARSSATYGLAGFHAVTPVAAQRDKIERIVTAWRAGTHRGADNRIDALEHVRVASSIDDAIAAVTAEHGRPPRVVATSARELPRTIGFADWRRRMADEPRQPVLLLFGTGWGLTDAVVEAADDLLAPIAGIPRFNHLSVRSAAAIILDRLFGLRAT